MPKDFLHQQERDGTIAVLLEYPESLEPVSCRVLLSGPELCRNCGYVAYQTSAEEGADDWRGFSGLERVLDSGGSKHFANAPICGAFIPSSRSKEFCDRFRILFIEPTNPKRFRDAGGRNLARNQTRYTLTAICTSDLYRDVAAAGQDIDINFHALPTRSENGRL